MLEESEIRKQKWQALTRQGIDPYPASCERDAMCAEAAAHFDEWSLSGKIVTLAGRVMITRVHGGIVFADLADASGRLQLAFKEDVLGDKPFVQFRDFVDPGDFVQAAGTLFETKRGEKTLEVKTWKMLAKALLPLPEKWHGLQDVEMRFRERELDLISNPDVKRRFILRSNVIRTLRHFLEQHEFMEVETPMFHPIPGGANARPFITHHNALDLDLYLRIAPELYLKRLLVGGFEKIFEIGRAFRNEGIDVSHNPEFTILEMYWAYAKKEEYLTFIEAMLSTMIRDVFGTLHIEHEQGAFDFKTPLPRQSFHDAVLAATGIDIDTCRSPKDVKRAARERKLEVDFGACVGLGEHFDALYKQTARKKIKGPMWVMDYPAEMLPLAKRSAEDPSKSATAQIVIHGTEIVKVFYHELNDPLEQRERFKAEEALALQGSEEAQRMDESFLQALEHGMPPTSGMGIGIDRLVALLTGASSLKEVIFFPTLKPEKGDGRK